MNTQKFIIDIEYIVYSDSKEDECVRYNIIDTTTGHIYAQAFDEHVAELICTTLNTNYTKN